MLTGMNQLPLRFSQLIVLVIAILDIFFVASMTLVTGGFDSPIYWIFVVLIIRNSISIPSAPVQITANLLVLFCYLGAGSIDMAIQEILSRSQRCLMLVFQRHHRVNGRFFNRDWGVVVGHIAQNIVIRPAGGLHHAIDP